MIVPMWDHRLNYEQELRKGRSIQLALWMSCKNKHHRMEHWCMLLTIANSMTPSRSKDISLQERVLEMEQKLRKRLRTSRRRAAQPR